MIISYQNLLKSAGISPDKLLIDPTIPDRWQKRPLKYSKPMRNPHVITSKQIPDDDDIVSSDDDEAVNETAKNKASNQNSNILLSAATSSASSS
ncbi:hypothetical protein BLA29_014035, partial [Euroglyphus maynei]